MEWAMQLTAIDTEFLAELQVLLGADIDQLISTFLDNTQASLRAIEKNISASDGELLRKAAHTLKGAAASVGALNLPVVLAALEECGRQGDFAAASIQLEVVRGAFVEYQIQYRCWAQQQN
jgi:HPt (histidine-containing phosphotransfer) domain-containing protein